jgi:hypothetical protein
LNLPPEPQSLRNLQSAFAAALRAPGLGPAAREFAQAIVDDGLPAAARLRIYRNNALAVVTDALRRTYPVLRRRVGDEYFDQLATEYRDAHPSRHGDLHWVGAEFPAWLGERLRGTDYEWLTDLARLEWACETSFVAADADPIHFAELGKVPPEMLAVTTLQLQPSVRLVSSTYPIWSVWQENQPEAAGRPVDLAAGAEHVVVCCTPAGLVLHSVPAAEHRFVAALAHGSSLGDSLESAALPVEQLPQALGWLFTEHLVIGLRTPARGNET